MEEERELQIQEGRAPRVAVDAAGNVVTEMGTAIPNWVANVAICTQWRACAGPVGHVPG